MSAVHVFEGNACWDAKLGAGRSGCFVTFGMATDDAQRFEVIAFGGVVSSAEPVCCGDRVRVTARRPAAERTWRTSDGSERHGVRLVASRVEVVDPLPAEDARRRIIRRVLGTSPGEVLEA